MNWSSSSYPAFCRLTQWQVSSLLLIKVLQHLPALSAVEAALPAWHMPICSAYWSLEIAGLMPFRSMHQLLARCVHGWVLALALNTGGTAYNSVETYQNFTGTLYSRSHKTDLHRSYIWWNPSMPFFLALGSITIEIMIATSDSASNAIQPATSQKRSFKTLFVQEILDPALVSVIVPQQLLMGDFHLALHYWLALRQQTGLLPSTPVQHALLEACQKRAAWSPALVIVRAMLAGNVRFLPFSHLDKEECKSASIISDYRRNDLWRYKFRSSVSILFTSIAFDSSLVRTNCNSPGAEHWCTFRQAWSVDFNIVESTYLICTGLNWRKECKSWGGIMYICDSAQ